MIEGCFDKLASFLLKTFRFNKLLLALFRSLCFPSLSLANFSSIFASIHPNFKSQRLPIASSWLHASPIHHLNGLKPDGKLELVSQYWRSKSFLMVHSMYNTWYKVHMSHRNSENVRVTERKAKTRKGKYNDSCS